MGDRENAAAALAHMPRWVAVHENTLAKLDAYLAIAGSGGFDVDDILRELDEARALRDRATGLSLDTAGDTTDRGVAEMTAHPCPLLVLTVQLAARVLDVALTRWFPSVPREGRP